MIVKSPELLPIVDFSSLTIVPSYKCSTSNCVYCCQKTRNGGYHNNCQEQIDTNRLQKFLRQYLTTVLVKQIDLIGGEITEYENCCELVNMLSREFPGIRLEIISNGQNHQQIERIIESSKYRQNILFKFSADGFGEVCDQLRKKKGYFDELLKSIKVVRKWYSEKNIFIKVRYFNEHEASIIKLSDYLKHEFQIPRSQIQLMELITPGDDSRDLSLYIKKLRNFSEIFWNGDCLENYPRSHPSYKPYHTKKSTSISYPGIRPNGAVYSCSESPCALKVGHINDTNVKEIIHKLVNLEHLNPTQCDSCLDGRFVRLNDEQNELMKTSK